MKYLQEFRNPELAERCLNRLHRVTLHPWTIMEVCGGQTHSLVKNGILDLLPKKIRMVHGPGCPVCVTPLHLIDKAVALAKKGITLFSFGDMLRVPGSSKSLLEIKAEGAKVKIVYSPLEAVKYAKEHPEEEVVFFAVGFETTAPANALAVLMAQKEGIRNFSILASHVLVPPAMEALLSDEQNVVQGFLAAGHVCTVMGIFEYVPIAKKYKVPIVVTGFEPLDLLQGILMTVEQLENGNYEVDNQYTRVVRPEGNTEAQRIIQKVFETVDQEWRGIGTIPRSGWEVKEELNQWNAKVKYPLVLEKAKECPDCIAGEIMKGLKKPYDCKMFGKKCTPAAPLGAPMVSSEGACAAYYHFANTEKV